MTPNKRKGYNNKKLDEPAAPARIIPTFNENSINIGVKYDQTFGNLLVRTFHLI